jgi:DNA-binding transcriptional ArsR family regulator
MIIEPMARYCKPEPDERVYEMQALICKAFANPIRLRMLDFCSNGEQPVAAVQQELGITAANVSQHLSVLKAAGVVSTRREGKQMFYSLAIPQVKQACGMIRDVLRARLAANRDLLG